jgi:hypothetical protein
MKTRAVGQPRKATWRCCSGRAKTDARGMTAKRVVFRTHKKNKPKLRQLASKGFESVRSLATRRRSLSRRHHRVLCTTRVLCNVAPGNQDVSTVKTNAKRKVKGGAAAGQTQASPTPSRGVNENTMLPPVSCRAFLCALTDEDAPRV